MSGAATPSVLIGLKISDREQLRSRIDHPAIGPKLGELTSAPVAVHPIRHRWNKFSEYLLHGYPNAIKPSVPPDPRRDRRSCSFFGLGGFFDGFPGHRFQKILSFQRVG